MAQRVAGGLEQGSFRLFRAAGIDVFVHWTWLLVAFFAVQNRGDLYHSKVWNVIEYVSLFGIVLLHEFGHALACRQVGGKADTIVLWPLGGVAYVAPPRRPGAVLWSIAAGPLVNVLLVPITVGVYLFSVSSGWHDTHPDFYHYLLTLAVINFSLLVFNMLPVYPLDGGQIVQALLWFVIGEAKSLLIVSVVGMIAGVAAVVLALILADLWLGILAAFVVLRSIAGYQSARALAAYLRLPRHTDAACPSCGQPPVAGDFWMCGNCQTRFDTFVHRGVCPNCHAQFAVTSCPSCGEAHPLGEWFAKGRAVGTEG